MVDSRPARAPPPVDADKRSPRTLSRVSANAPSPRPQPPSTGLVTYPRSEGRFAGVCTVPAGRSAARRDAPVCVSASRGAVPHQTPKTPPTAETCLLTQCPAAVAHSTDERRVKKPIKRSTLAILCGRNLIGRESEICRKSCERKAAKKVACHRTPRSKNALSRGVWDEDTSTSTSSLAVAPCRPEQRSAAPRVRL